MQKFYNATQAALEIGISYKTVIRKIESGKIEAIKGDDGQYSIAATEVERLRILQSTRPQPVKSTVVLSGQDQLALEQRVTDLERRVRTLEDQASRVHTPLVETGQHKTGVDIPPKPKPTKQPSTRKDLPEGCILASKFAEMHGIPRETMRDYLTLGIGPGTVPGKETHPTLPVKDVMEYSERPWPGREHTGEKQRYFTPDQKEQALALLKKHGKLS